MADLSIIAAKLQEQEWKRLRGFIQKEKSRGLSVEQHFQEIMRQELKSGVA